MSRATELIEKYKMEETVPNPDLVLAFMDLMNVSFLRKKKMKKPEAKEILSSLDSTGLKKFENYLRIVLSGIELPKQTPEEGEI